MIFGEGKDEEIKKYVDGVFAKAGFLAVFFSQSDHFARCKVDMGDITIGTSNHSLKTF